MNPINVPREIGDGLLSVLNPVVRYSGTHETGKVVQLTGNAWEWENAGTMAGTSHAGPLCFHMRARASAPGAFEHQWVLEIAVEVREPVRVYHCAVATEIRAASAPYGVDGSLRWSESRHDASLHDFGQSVFRWKAADGLCAELRPLKGSHAVRYCRRRNQLHLEVLLDAATLHPRWQFTERGMESTATPVLSPGERITISLVLTVLRGSHERPPFLASRFPGGTEAAFVLTDHCDFDDTAFLRRFLHGDQESHGWMGRGLRMTKGVFMHTSSPPDRKPIPTLQDPEYVKMIEELYHDGSEIAPHAFSEVGTLAPAEFHDAVRKFSRRWTPATWIDHGKSIAYCYTMGGGANPGFDLLRTLRNHAFTTLWSYHDTPVPGCAGLNMLQRPAGTLLPLARQSMQHIIRAEGLIGLHYVRTIVGRVFTGRRGRAMMQSISAVREMAINLREAGSDKRQVIRRAWKRVAGSFSMNVRRSDAGAETGTTRKDRMESVGVVYPERGAPLHQVKEEDLLLFTTMEAVHTRDMYSPGALDRLVHERGLHIGHSYLLNRLPYIAGIFEKKTGRLTHSWNQFVDSLASLVRAGRLWNPTAGGLAGWIRDRELVTLIPVAPAEVRMENPLPRPVRDFTLLLPRDTRPAGILWGGKAPSGWRQWDDWLAVWGDLPTRSSVTVLWGAVE
jgi:hypothetical protein